MLNEVSDNGITQEQPPAAIPRSWSETTMRVRLKPKLDEIRFKRHVITTSMPSLDLVGINSFYGKFNNDWQGGGFLNQLSGYIKKLGKPWCLSEYYSYDLLSPPFTGYKGMPYQTLNGSYNYYLELNSTSNAQNYSDAWNNYVVGNKDNGCVGACALNWDPPHNSQCNAFWKQMFAYAGYWEIYVDLVQQIRRI